MQMHSIVRVCQNRSSGSVATRQCVQMRQGIFDQSCGSARQTIHGEAWLTGEIVRQAMHQAIV